MDRYDFMREALNMARIAFDDGEVPVGCVIVKDNTIIAKTRNLSRAQNCATKHAEILAIEEASAVLKSANLSQCDLYVTLEPCPMCAGAILQARVGRVICGAGDPMMGAMGSVWTLHQHPMRLTQHTNVYVGCCEDACVGVLREFFRQRRRDSK